jgi:hypothetical protein
MASRQRRRIVAFLPDAQAEFDDAIDWYEQQRTGLGSDYMAAVRDVIDQIRAVPGLHATVRKNVRMAIVQRFPYAIFIESKQTALQLFWSSIQAATHESGAAVPNCAGSL